MDNKTKQAMQMALEDLREVWPDSRPSIVALREALAEPDMNLSCKSVQARLATSWGYVKAEQAEQEPVAEVVLHSHKVGFGRTEERKDIVFLADVEVGTKLYAAPVRTKNLTDYEIGELILENKMLGLQSLARAVIAADREKNK